MIPFLTKIPSPYLYGGIFLAGLMAGSYGVHTWHKAQRADAIEEARQTERALQVTANKADADYAAEMFNQAEHSKRNAAKYRRLLDEANSELDDCRVDARLISVLNDAGMSTPAADPPGIGQPAEDTPEARDSNCAAELDVCRSNYADVCVPNEIQLRDLQKFTRDLIEQHNKAVK